jgi:microcystin-dependent protein
VTTDRIVETPEETVARHDRELADLRSTLLARVDRKSTGDVELAFRASPKPGTLFMQGQTLNRADYPALWKWAQDVGAVVTGGYGAGNGSTTFTLPDMRGLIAIGVGTGAGSTVGLGQVVGSATVTLTSAEIAGHTHPASSTTHEHGSAPHTHDLSGGHDHGVHGHDIVSVAPHSSGTGSHVTNPTSSSTASTGGHTHGNTGGHTHGDTGSHTHTVNANTGGGAHENRQASRGWHYAVWT